MLQLALSDPTDFDENVRLVVATRCDQVRHRCYGNIITDVRSIRVRSNDAET